LPCYDAGYCASKHTGDGMAWADAIALATTVPAFVIVLRACWRSRNTRHREKP
jgi:hypothetical protein